MISLQSLEKQSIVWRKPYGNLFPDSTNKIKQGGPSILSWGYFYNKTPGPLVFVDETINHKKYIDILNEVLLPFVRPYFPDGRVLFQNDN